MDSSGSDSGSGSSNHQEATGDQLLLGTSPGGASTASMGSRERTDSESSDHRGQPRFVLPGAAGTPSKILTIDEVQHALTNLDNMQLAHEIAVNPNFRLKQYKPAANTLERNIKDMVHRAFWASIREQLAEDPPCYDHAIQLLADIKDGFAHILASNNRKALERICEVLDATVIRQQAEQGVLDFRSYAIFIVQIMARSCAPVRDEAVAQLAGVEDVLDQFRGILEVMELMKLDMANCMIESARKVVMTHSIEYEKECFREYLDVYTGAFPATEAWLLRHRPEESVSPDTAILAAYVELLQPRTEAEAERYAFPETVNMDRERVEALAARCLRLSISAAVLALVTRLPLFAGHAGRKAQVRQQVDVLLEAVKDERTLAEALEGVWLQVRTLLRAAAEEMGAGGGGGGAVDEEMEQSLRGQIMLLAERESPVRTVMTRRLMGYAALIVSKSQATPPAPPGYTDYADELELFIAFRRITFYNYMVFGDFYHKVLRGETAGAAELAAATAVAAVAAAPAEGESQPAATAAASGSGQ